MISQPSIEVLARILHICRKARWQVHGLHLHVFICRMCLETHNVLGNYLVAMMVDIGSIFRAKNVFSNLVFRGAASWNSLITAYLRYGHLDQGLDLYTRMSTLKDDSVQLSGHTFVALLQTCTKANDLLTGVQIHCEIARHSLLEKDPFLGTALVNMYAKCGSLFEAQEVFNKLPLRNVVTWNAIITTYLDYDLCEEALQCFMQMQQIGVHPDAVTYISILKVCGILNAIDEGWKIHFDVERMGFLETDLAVGNSLISMYIKLGLLVKAQEVFDKLPVQDVVTWTALIEGYAAYGYTKRSFECIRLMQHKGVLADDVALLSILKAFIEITDVELLQSGMSYKYDLPLKSEVLQVLVQGKTCLESNLRVWNLFVHVLGKHGFIKKANHFFQMLPVRDTVSWNTLMSGYSEHGCADKALKQYDGMKLEGIHPDVVSYIMALKCCGRSATLGKGYEIHSDVTKLGFCEMDLVIGSSLVNMYAKCQSLVSAEKVLSELPIRGVVAWTALIAGYAEYGYYDGVVKCSEKMQLEGVLPDMVTLICILKICGDTIVINKIKDIFVEFDINGFTGGNLIFGNALISMYAKRGLFVEAEQVFHTLPSRDIVSWNTLIGGYVEHGYDEEAFNCFAQMHHHGLSPDVLTFLHVSRAYHLNANKMD